MPVCHGTVLLCDIVGFSRKAPQEQARVVKSVSRWLDDQLDAEHWSRWPYVNGTGDGFLLVIEDDSLVDASTYEWCLTFARKLYAFCRSYPKMDGVAAKLEMRVAIHWGDFFRPVSSFGTNAAVGKALNWTARIDVGDPGQVIVSKEFRDRVIQRKRREHLHRFDGPKDGYDLVVKHGEVATVYQYVGGKEGTVRKGIPKKILRTQAVSDTIDLQLEQLTRDLTEALGGADSMKPLTSVYLPADGHRELALTQFSLLSRSLQGIKYPIISWDIERGPASLAWRTGKPVVVRGLPSADASPSQWVRGFLRARTIDARPLDLRRKDLMPDLTLISRSQSYVCVRVGYPELDGYAVLMVEFKDDLSSLHDDRLLQIAARHADSAQARLAPLLALRLRS